MVTGGATSGKMWVLVPSVPSRCHRQAQSLEDKDGVVTPAQPWCEGKRVEHGARDSECLQPEVFLGILGFISCAYFLLSKISVGVREMTQNNKIPTAGSTEPGPHSGPGSTTAALLLLPPARRSPPPSFLPLALTCPTQCRWWAGIGSEGPGPVLWASASLSVLGTGEWQVKLSGWRTRQSSPAVADRPRRGKPAWRSVPAGGHMNMTGLTGPVQGWALGSSSEFGW